MHIWRKKNIITKYVSLNTSLTERVFFSTFGTFPKTSSDFDLKLYKVVPVFKGKERDLFLADNG